MPHECQIFLLLTFAGETATPALTADAAAFVPPKYPASFLPLLNFVAACLARGRARQAWPKVLVYYDRVVGTATPRHIGYGR